MPAWPVVRVCEVCVEGVRGTRYYRWHAPGQEPGSSPLGWNDPGLITGSWIQLKGDPSFQAMRLDPGSSLGLERFVTILQFGCKLIIKTMKQMWPGQLQVSARESLCLCLALAFRLLIPILHIFQLDWWPRKEKRWRLQHESHAHH